MSDTAIGVLIGPDAQRDAIHIAVAPVTAAHNLEVGAHIGFVDKAVDFGLVDYAVGKIKAIGIVDPYLSQRVYAGQRFWIHLYPRTITSLKHSWTHPDFVDDVFVPQTIVPATVLQSRQVTEAVSKTRRHSQKWMEDYAQSEVQMSYLDFMDAMEVFLRTGEYISLNFDSPNIPPEFWEHYENIIEDEVPLLQRDHFFSCAC